MAATNVVMQAVTARPVLAVRPAQAKAVMPARFIGGVRSRAISKSAFRQNALACRRVAAASAEPEAAAEAEAAPAAEKIDIKSIQVGQMLKGTVKSTTAYGAFIDIGANKDGLVHISQLSNSFVSDVNEVVKPGQEVEVRVLDVDVAKGRLGLSMKTEAPASDEEGTGNVPARGQVRQARRNKGKREDKSKLMENLPFSAGDKITGKVTRTVAFGAFVEVAEGVEGLLHQSEIMIPEGKSEDSRVDALVSEGEEIEVTVLDIKSGKISLSNKTDEYRAQEEKYSSGLSVVVPDAANSLEYALRKAGIKATDYSGAAAEVSSA